MMNGYMFHYCEENRNLLAFVSVSKDQTVCRNALVLVPGLGDGFMTLRYTEHLSSELVKIGYSLVQVNLSSSFQQYGFNSLKSDGAELAKLVKKMKQLYKFERICMLGHSTGTQGVMFLVRREDTANSLDAIILQGAVSDRDFLATETQTPQMLKEAQALKEEGKEDAFLSEKLFGAPLTAYRFLSLAGRLTDDDMFSVDLTEEELEPILSPVRIPILLCFSEHDEYVPDIQPQKAVAQRMVKILKRKSPRVECKYFIGDHGLSKLEYHEPFVECVCGFLSSLTS